MNLIFLQTKIISFSITKCKLWYAEMLKLSVISVYLIRRSQPRFGPYTYNQGSIGHNQGVNRVCYLHGSHKVIDDALSLGRLKITIALAPATTARSGLHELIQSPGLNDSSHGQQQVKENQVSKQFVLLTTRTLKSSQSEKILPMRDDYKNLWTYRRISDREEIHLNKLLMMSW